MKCITCEINEAIPDEPYCVEHRPKGRPGLGYMPNTSDPPIIISGGSVTIDFDKSLLRETPDGKHGNPYKRIKRVEITGDVDIISDANAGFSGNTNSGRVTVKIYYGDA